MKNINKCLYVGHRNVIDAIASKLSFGIEVSLVVRLGGGMVVLPTLSLDEFEGGIEDYFRKEHKFPGFVVQEEFSEYGEKRFENVHIYVHGVSVMMPMNTKEIRNFADYCTELVYQVREALDREKAA